VALAHGATVGAAEKLFQTYCTACHDNTGLGSHGGANLMNAAKDAKFVITTGRDDMPSFKGVLNPEQLRDVAGHITTDLFPPN
jgi:mono/diheme cytochrome c family protein